MASVDWKKISGNAAGLISHATRHDGKAVKFSNEDIDPERSKNNYTVLGFHTGTRAVEFFFGRRVKELDEIHPPKRIRKDRVTRIGFCLTVPEGLPPSQERAFFRMAHEEIARTCGGRDNVTNGYVHVDEVHRYYDKLSGDYKYSRALEMTLMLEKIEGRRKRG